MFSKGTTSFGRELPECGLSSKEGRYQSETLSLSTLDKDEEKVIKDESSVAQNGPNGRLDLLGRPIPGARYRAHSERYRKLQLACYNFLERPRGVLTHLYHASICVLVIVSLVLTALTTVNTKHLNYWTILHTPVLIVEFVLVLVFLVEYGLRLWSAGCRSTYVGIQGRLKFAKKTYAILDLVVIISSICALVLVATSKVASTPVSLIRFLPLLRVLRFDRQGGTWKLLASVIYIHRQELVTTLYLGFISLIFASFVLYLVEKDENTKFDSWPNSFWWGIVTLTTIGYGDKTPITWYGRLCAALFAVFGISFFALPAGILGSGFALKVTQQQRQKHFHRRRRPAAILLQSHWRMYCADINSKSVATWLPHIYYNRQGTSDKIISSSVADSSSNNTAKKGRKLSAVWRNRNEGKSSRSQSVDVIRASRSDSSPLVDSGGSATQRGSISSTLDTGFFVPGENLHCTLVYTKKPFNTSRTFASDEANISLSEDGETHTITLSQAQKHAIRLIRLLKLNVAIRKFKEARKPYDVKDVIEQYSTGHVEMLSRMKSLQQRIDKVSGERENSVYEDNNFKSNVSARLMKVEHQVTVLDRKVDIILELLTKMTGTDPKILETLPGASPPPPSPGTDQIEIGGLPKVVIGSDKNLESRTRSESFPSTHVLSDNIPPWNPKHSQSDPVLKFDATSDLLRIQAPRTPSLSSEDSHDSKDMDCLSTPGMTTVSPNRILGAHGRQLSDVTEGDESVSSDSKENALDNKFSRESTLDSIEDAQEPTSPSEDVEIPMYDPLINPYVSPDQQSSADMPKETLAVWEKKPSETPRPRPRSYKNSSTSSFGTLVGSMENDGNSSIEVFTEESMEKEDGASSKSREPSEVDSGSIDSDQTVVSSDDTRARRRALKRCTPIEV